MLLDTGSGTKSWDIAVRSGGHNFGGSNNIDQGVIIDVGYLNKTTYNKKKKTLIALELVPSGEQSILLYRSKTSW